MKNDLSQQLPRGFNNAQKLEARLRNEPEKGWIKRGEKRALALFHDMAKRVPAYKDFLHRNKVIPSKIKTIEDFAKLPTIDKDNYLRKYPKEQLCWDGKFGQGWWTISTTSGSTGKPYYFPRQKIQDVQYATLAEQYLRTNYRIQDKSTLYIVAFPMGAWIGGLFTYEAIKIIAEKGNYDMSVITPGINKLEVINSIKQLSKHFDQVIIGAYAPFLKDIIDDGKRMGIKWDKLDIGFVFSAEAFTEKFRDYVIKSAGIKDPLRSTLNHYGTVDMGTMAHETALSIMLRRQIFEDNSLLHSLFPDPRKEPTFAQYIPELYYFEQTGNNLLCTSQSGIPLVRYDLKDYGGVLSFNDIKNRFSADKYDVDKLINRHKINDTVWNLPFIYVYERDDFSVSYYAFLIYPDTVRRALQADELINKITCKFSMLVDYDSHGRQQLHIHIELKHGVKSGVTLKNKLINTIHKQLTEDSSEYRELYRMINSDAKPTVHLWEYEDPTHFAPGTKQKWVK